MKGQKVDVLRHLKDYGSITSFEAFTEYGITRLSARVFELRDMGYEIATTPIRRKNRYGNQVQFAKYTLVKEGI